MESQTIPVNESYRLFTEAINDRKIILWEDPGHGWLQVPIPLIKELQAARKLQISGYSYRDINGENAYLEEDCDLGAFVNCFPSVNFRQMFEHGQIERKYAEHIFIRELPHWK